MNGFQHLPSQQDQRFWVYTGNKTGGSFQTWLKPPNISFVHIICIGGGGGGSGTYPYTAGSAARGGGGGGSGALNSVFLPAYLIPDRLFISVGTGGAGGAASTVVGTANAGIAGGTSYVSFHPVVGSGYALCLANAGAGAAVPVAGGTGAAGGSGGATVNSTSFPYSQIGLRNYIGGQTGGTGGTNTVTTQQAVYRIMGGAPGAGNSAANLVGSGSAVWMAGDYALTTVNYSPAGMNGAKIEDLVKFIAGGGTGASSSTTISGSNGGWGGFGSGGGGGSVGPGIGGAGGNGGDGLVIITCG